MAVCVWRGGVVVADGGVCVCVGACVWRGGVVGCWWLMMMVLAGADPACRYISGRIFGAELVIAIMILTGFSFIPAGFVLFLVQERATKAKHLQFVSGLNPLVYWISNIIWDMVRGTIL